MNPRLTAATLEILRRLPVSSEILGPPKGYHRHTEDWFASGSRAALSSRFRQILPPWQSLRRKPLTLDGMMPWQFHAFCGGMTVRDPRAWVAEIPKGRVVGHGAVITPDDRLLADVSREFIVGGDQSKHSVLHRRRLPPVRRVPGKVAVLSVTDGNYWHWFFDLLPRLLLLWESRGTLEGIDAFIVNQIRHRYQKETLERLGVPAGKIIESHRSRFHIKADVLIVPSVFRDVPAKWACRMLRERLSNEAGTERGPSRLYISRSDANTRRVLNEDVLMEKLSELGFEKVSLRGRSVSEQCDLFSSAEFVVAPHGAGLTNLLFCREGTRILEIFPPTYVNPCYWVLSNHLGLEYYCSVGEGFVPPEPPEGTNQRVWFWSFVEADKRNGKHIRANLDDLLPLLDWALGAGGQSRG